VAIFRADALARVRRKIAYEMIVRQKGGIICNSAEGFLWFVFNSSRSRMWFF